MRYRPHVTKRAVLKKRMTRFPAPIKIAAILSLFAFLSATAVFGQRVSEGQREIPEEIFYNGKVTTVDSGFQIQEAFAIRGKKFFAVGSNAVVKALAGPTTILVDLKRHAVIPGLMDNHTHQYYAALVEFRGIDLVGVPSLAEMLKRLREAVAKAKPGETIVTTAGWDPRNFPEKRGPERNDLDQLSSDHPIVIFQSRNGVRVNRAALNAVGISRETKLFEGDPVQKDAEGEPAGVFTNPGPVNYITEKLVRAPSEAELKEMLRKIQDELHGWGLTSTREVELPPEIMRAYGSLLHDGKLTMRIAMGLDVSSADADKMEQILKPWGVGSGFGNHQLRLDSIGEFGTEAGADKHYLREPYANRTDRGELRITPAQLRQAMLTINRYGWRPSIHVMGDAALDAVLDAYEAADAEKSIRDKRWVVEHIPLVHPDQMERMARLGVVVSAQIQPYFSADRFIRDYGKERADDMVPMRELIDHHLHVSTGSDWGGLGDVYEMNPFVNIYFYVSRKTKAGTMAGAAQKISREEALRVSTINNAYMTFEESVKGSIEPGKLADFVILSQDILTIAEDKIPSIRPLATYVGGQKVFSSKDGGF